MTTLEAIIDQDGRVSLRRGVTLPAERRAILVVLDEPPVADADGGDERAGSGLECALMSEAALAEIWDTPEEEEHWAYLNELPDLRDERDDDDGEAQPGDRS